MLMYVALAAALALAAHARRPEDFTCAPEQQPVTVGVEAGLANRLRVLASLMRECGGPENVTFVWNTTAMCEGHFDEFFEVPANTTILYDGAKPENFSTYAPFLFRDHSELMYEWLCLKPEFRVLVHEFLRRHTNYFCMHVRQTDLVNILAKQTEITGVVYDDDYFLSKAAETLAAGPYKEVYIATDNHDTQRRFIERFGSKVLFFEQIPDVEVRKRRKTTLLHSVMDLFLCSAGKHFIGTPKSSFSDLAKNLHTHRLYKCNTS
jgi:hypothetical protein